MWVVTGEARDRRIALLKASAELETHRLESRYNGLVGRRAFRLGFVTMAFPAQSNQLLTRRFSGIPDVKVGCAGLYGREMSCARSMADFTGHTRNNRVEFRTSAALFHVSRMAMEAAESVLRRHELPHSLLQSPRQPGMMAWGDVKPVLPPLIRQTVLDKSSVIKTRKKGEPLIIGSENPLDWQS